MGRGVPGHRSTATRLIAGIVLVLFALRAFVPAGFMPDARALSRGSFELVICTSSGEKIVHVADIGSVGDPEGPAPAKSPGDDCPFHFAAAKDFTVPAALPLALDFARPSNDGYVRQIEFLSPPAQGPPLGSRAPPVHLG